MIVGFIISVVLLFLVSGVVIPMGRLGKFERERRKHQRGIEVMRELYYVDIVSIQRALTALLVVAQAAFSVAAFGWVLGLIIAAFVALEYGAVSRLKAISSPATKLYGKVEPQALAFCEKYAAVTKVVRSFVIQALELEIHSRDELAHVITNLEPQVITDNEKQSLLSMLTLSEKTVHDVMTQRAAIVSVKKHEMLGPLVLDDLHKSGHSHFPVIDGSLDRIVGILHINDYLTIDTTKKHTSKAESAMDANILTAAESTSLEQALQMLLEAHHHTMIVTNHDGTTVGLVTLHDILREAFGRSFTKQ